MIIPAYFEDLHIHHLGTEPNRSYFIPTAERMDDLVEHRENSDRFQLLNGDWKFRYCRSIHDFTEFFYAENYDVRDWDSIPVPSVWQNHGYDQHQYTNIRYPFPADPPYVPVDNPCGAYRVHGGGFAGTVQAFVPLDMLKDFKTNIEEVLGQDRCHVLNISARGGACLS